MKFKLVPLVIGIICLLGFLAGCGKEAEPEKKPQIENGAEGYIDESIQITVVPAQTKIPEKKATAMPTASPTNTPTDTPTPTYTPTPTPDVEPPVILGVNDLVVTIDSNVSYTKGVTAEDGSGESFSFRGENPNLFVDTSMVNMKKAGTYPVIYSAVDSAGNRTEVAAYVTVTAADVSKVYEEADKALSVIIYKENMSTEEIAKGILIWVRQNIEYVGEVSGGDYLKSAYQGFSKRRGACYVFASVSQVLMERAGIPSMIIAKDESKDKTNGGPHFWNIINLGEGWHHFDATIWHVDTADKEVVKSGIFNWTNARMKSSQSMSIRNQHKYDESLYPTIE